MNRLIINFLYDTACKYASKQINIHTYIRKQTEIYIEGADTTKCKYTNICMDQRHHHHFLVNDQYREVTRKIGLYVSICYKNFINFCAMHH